ncbi:MULTISPECIES: putative baseplate assembly protein [unclassified Streptomyces]|uniref:putative baseplate assembly protein n=1 Tax=unclassified Streptomyces TaxID=2593676 RepID=UPI001E3120E0|nr:putative baseplate assembly protein [Streptomyces sp. MBT42]MCD2462308.1 putative baseplate assembly protein [Streptomyces sp. MBT42]
MALPAPHLDDRRFQQFVDDAKRYIQQACPEWTDHNVSDPGVTLVEAVAHMADQLVYRLNRVPEKNHLAFLDLLGVTLFPPAAARADITFRLSAPQPEPVVLPTGTEVSTGRTETEEAVVFATAADLTVVPCSLTHVLRQEAGGAPEDRSQDLRGGADVPAFSPLPRVGDLLLLGLSAAVPDCVLVLDLDSRVDGVGVDPRRPPLVWEAWTGAEGWVACEVDEDSTGGLNRPGEVVLHMPSGHAVSRLGGHEAGWVRCRVVEAATGLPSYSESPTVRAAEAFTIGGTVRAAHAEAVRNERLGESEGVPAQRLRLAHAPVVDRPPLLLQVAERADSGVGEEEAEAGWQEWTVVRDFASSRPGDRHFTLDATTGEVAFGPSVRQPDGTLRQFGAVPPKGAAIRAVRYGTGGGRAGNVARSTITVLRSSIPYIARVENREAARGGVDGETVEEAKSRAPISLRAQERAVTARDYEELARRAAPEAARIACLAADAAEAGDNAVRVLVVPQAVPDRGGRLRFEQLVPGEELLSRVTGFLDERRPLGTRLAVGPPFYQGVTVVATLHSFRAAEAERVRAEALDALYAYLDPLTGGAHGEGWPFGRPLRAGEVFAALQRVPGVELVDEVLLHPADPLTGRRGDTTDRIELAPSALLFPFDHRVRVIEAR